MRYLLLAVALFAASAVFAKEINFSQIVTDQDGAPVMDCQGAGCSGPPLTLGAISMRALTAQFDDDKTVTGEEKFKRGELALRVYKGGMIDLSVEDIATIKKLIARGYGPLIVARGWVLLDPQQQHAVEKPAEQPRVVPVVPADRPRVMNKKQLFQFQQQP